VFSGIIFGLDVRNKRFKDNNKSKESNVLNSWLCLCESLKQEIKNVNTNINIDGIERVSTIDETSSQAKRLSYSSVSVLFYRKYFLDDVCTID